MLVQELQSVFGLSDAFSAGVLDVSVGTSLQPEQVWRGCI